VIVSCRGTVGLVAIAGVPLVISQSFYALVPGERVNSRFLAYCIEGNRDRLLAVAGGNTILGLPGRTLREIEVDVPPIEEQRRIADLVRAIDRSISAESRRAVASWAILMRSIDALLNNPLWSLKRLDEVSEVRGGITKGHRSRETRPVPYLRVANVQHGWLNLNEIKEIEATEAEIGRHAVRASDVLLLEGGNKEDVGRGWIWSGEIEECLHQNHLHRARPAADVIEPRFLAYAICRSEARSYCLLNGKQTSNLATINRTQICGLPIRVPGLSEQRRVVGLLDAIRSDWESASSDVASLRKLREAVLAALLTGAHEIPESYDRFVPENGAELGPESIMV
jgi:type I restriction enzyme S subunit